MIDWGSIYEKLIGQNNKQLIKGKYYEKHHIIPRYLGGDNSNKNLVFLTFRDHTLAHYILWKWKGNLEDKIAYKMMSGQTEEGRILKQQLAIQKSNQSNKIEKIKETFSNREKVNQIIEKRKSTRYKNNNGKWYSDESLLLKSKKIKNKYNEIHSGKAIKKRIESLKKTIQNMTEEEFYNRYVKNMEGPLHPMYGKKRPGELAGNYGKTKGQYVLIKPNKEEIIFNGIKELIKYGMNELTIRKWVNNGAITKDPKCRKVFKWEGYEVLFQENPNYGNTNKVELIDSDIFIWEKKI
jgi:hypothetical protein